MGNNKECWGRKQSARLEASLGDSFPKASQYSGSLQCFGALSSKEERQLLPLPSEEPQFFPLLGFSAEKKKKCLKGNLSSPSSNVWKLGIEEGGWDSVHAAPS